MGSRPISIYCPYCNKYTALSYAPGFGDPNYPSQRVFAIWQKSEDEKYWIGICNSCHKAVLVYECLDIIRAIYPYPLPSPTDERIPENIRRDIDEAKICFSVNAYRACAVMARRAIQLACIDKGADKKQNLAQQIDELAEKGVITKELQQWAHAVRWIGNDAAHPENPEVTKEDAEDVLKLAEQFMEVIYVTPAIAKELSEKRDKKTKK